MVGPGGEGEPKASWDEELFWARRGNFHSLLESLRSNKPLLGNEQRTRAFIADFLEGKIARPRGRAPKPPQRFPALWGIEQTPVMLPARHKTMYEAARRVWQYQREQLKRGRKEGAFEEALDEVTKDGDVSAVALRNWMHRPLRGRG